MPTSSTSPALWVPRVRASFRERWNTLREDRVGIMLHYDGSRSDVPGIDWVAYHPDARGSYNWMITDFGQEVSIVPSDRRAWHAGRCQPSFELTRMGVTYGDANSAFYGLSITATDGDRATPAQFESVVQRCIALFLQHKWRNVYRITGHDREAWPRGRKIDPTGTGRLPVLSVLAVRTAVAERLG